jgi:hypothetical protein
MAHKERLMQEALELPTDDEWIVEVERRARRALAGEPGVSWTDARKQLEQRFGSF